MKVRNRVKIVSLLALVLLFPFTIHAQELKAVIEVNVFNSEIKEASLWLYPVEDSIKVSLIESGSINTSKERKELEKIDKEITKSNIQPVVYMPNTSLPAKIETNRNEIYFLKAKSQDLSAYSLIETGNEVNPVYLKFDKTSNPPKKDSNQNDTIHTSVSLNTSHWLSWFILALLGAAGLGVLLKKETTK